MVSAPTASERALRPSELSTAAAMSSVAVGLVVLGTVVPHAGPAQAFAVVPFGIVAHRHRLRALIAATVAGAFLAALVIGTAGAFGLVQVAVLGGFVGVLKRRGWRFASVCASNLVLAPLLAGAADLALWAIASYRKLVFATVKSTVAGLASVLHHISLLRPIGHWLTNATGALIAYWPITIAAVIMLVTPAYVIGSWLLLGEVLERLRWAGGSSPLGDLPQAPVSEDAPAPLPVRLQAVSVRYGDRLALDDIDLELPIGQFVGLVGDNGSGKSTLAQVLAGLPPTDGEVTRHGLVGLGQIGGTALIGQRPDAQVLGLHVAEDVVWGLPPDHETDVEALLSTVGLAGRGEDPTSTLSGGQLQRLAVAAALARRPRLLISDESTAMIDPPGRAELVGLLAKIPHHWPMTVVHISHNRDELDAADRVVRLDHGRVVEDSVRAAGAAAMDHRESPSELATPRGPWPVRATHRSDAELGVQQPAPKPLAVPKAGGLVLDAVSHSYAHGTVWQRRAIQDISLSIFSGEGVLMVGPNGSGKSTLAWVIAGLIRPTHGTCRLDGEETRQRRGAVAIAFQHARLQLQRPTVGADVADAAGWLMHAGRVRQRELLRGELKAPVADALAAVRLDPELASRSIEELSGGQQRRVAIAGLLARNPAVLVLDEPLAGLDLPTRSALVELLSDLRQTTGLTLIVVTHDPEPLAGVCPRVVTLEDGRLIGDSLDPSGVTPPMERAA